MKPVRIAWLALLAALALVAFAPAAVAFHSGGVAECSGCHSMHEAVGTPLLQGSDYSSTCLNCHQHAGDTGPTSYHVSTAEADMPPGVPPKQRNPGGDFGWLKKTYTTTASYGAPIQNNGWTHGHNIVAADYGYTADPENTTAPGGTMSSAELSCVSCHGPHNRARRLADGTVVTPSKAQGTTYPPIYASGSYGAEPTSTLAVGVYRLLRGAGSTAFDAVTFSGVPPAVAPSAYNRSEATTQTRVAYGYSPTANGYDSWGRWCATCHPDMHSDVGYVHEVDSALGSGIADNYNKYVKTGDLSGTSATSYSSLVPFNENTADASVLKGHAKTDDSVLTGPTAADRLSCMTCHRAHASAWEHALRWNMEGEFLTMADSSGNPVYPATDAAGTTPDGRPLSSFGQFHRGYSTAEMKAAYYDREATKFAAYQRALCNKCHIKD